jgi:hypothetical protein
MAKVKALTHSFNNGEISRAARARVDLEKVRLTAEIQENILPHAIGAGQFRPGFGYLGSTRSNAFSRMEPFVRSRKEVAMGEFSAGKLRIWVDDAPLTRPAVTSAVTNGDFSSSTGWTLTATDGATAAISGGVLTLTASARGSSCFCERSVSTSSAGTEHALRIVVTRGPITFRCGSTSGDDDLIRETTLDTGVHSLSFTPSGTYYVRFLSRRDVAVIVDSITVESAGVVELDGPWTIDDLPRMRIGGSIDVFFVGCDQWQQRKIERRSQRSWSVTLYQSDDGPLTAGSTAKVRLKPAANVGNTTLTADGSFFKPEHVGALFRLTHTQLDQTVQLAGAGQYTPVFQVTGINTTGVNDRSYTTTTTGTWVGTWNWERSYDDETAGFNRWFNDRTTNYAGPASEDSASNNLTAFHRVGFIPGGYTSGVMTVRIQYTGSAGSGVCRVTGYTSPTEVPIEVLSPFNDVEFTDDWQESEWSGVRGWPSAVSFFDGRIFWGGNDKLWGSVSNNFYSFSTDVEGDSGPILRSVATGQGVNIIRWMLPLQRLQIGTDSSEISARASSFDEPLTPDAVTLKDASTQGCADISAVKIDSRGLFVQASGEKVYELIYDFEANDYTSRDLNSVNDEIFEDAAATQMAVQRQPESYVWIVREDGVLAFLLFDPKEEITGWFKVITDGDVEAVCVLPGDPQDRVYVVVKRTINGSDVRYVEKLAMHREARGGSTNKMADSGVLFAGPASSVTVAHLANETGLVAWGTKSGTPQAITGLSANGSGVVSLGDTYTNIWIGLSYRGRYKSAKLAYGGQGGTAVIEKKRVEMLGILAGDMHRDAVQYGTDFDHLYPLPAVENGQVVADHYIWNDYAQPLTPMDGTWDTDARVCLEMQAPYPATLYGLVIAMDTNVD